MLKLFRYRIKKILSEDIIKVFSFNAISTLVRMLCGMISVKIVALIVGPSGVALLGQLGNFNTILLGLANGGINNGVTKYVSEYKDDVSNVKKYVSAALRITGVCSLFISIVLIIGCRQLSRLILLSDEYSYVFVIFGFTLILYSLNFLLISIINGYKEFKKYVYVNIAGTIFGLFYTILLVIIWGLNGALINTVTYQSVVFFITLWMCRKSPWLNKSYFVQKKESTIIKKYLRYSLMSIISLMMLPVSQMVLRGHVMTELSSAEAGWWEAMNRISGMYLNVFTTAFAVYYLPRLSEITDKIELRKEILRCYKVIIPILLTAVLTIYSFKHFIVWLLFTPDFYPMESLFIWQLLGDFMKMMSWMLAYIMIAKAQTKLYIVSEVFFTLVYVGLCFVLLHNNGIIGLTQGYFLNYIIYTLAMLFIFRKVLLVI